MVHNNFANDTFIKCVLTIKNYRENIYFVTHVLFRLHQHREYLIFIGFYKYDNY